MEKRKAVVTFNGNPLTLMGTEIKVGAKAPEFEVVSKTLAPVKLSDYDGKVRIVSVVPSIDTAVCDMQTRRFNEEAAKLADVVVLSISVDLPFALAKYCAANGIESVQTLSDHKELDFGLKYGFVIEELRLLTRGIVVIDQEGIVKHVEYVKEMTEHPNYGQALVLAKQCLG